MKRLEQISDVEKEILKSMSSGPSRGLTTSRIKDVLTSEGYQTTLDEVRKGIGELITYGSVRGYVTPAGKRVYYLSRGLGSGHRNQAKLMGKTNVFMDAYKLFKRIFSAVFLLFGLGSIIFLGLSPTGKVISISAFPVNIAVFLSFLLIFIGAALALIDSRE